MPATETSLAPETDRFPEGSVDAAIYPTPQAALEHSLVPLAMGETCWLIPAEDGLHLRVEPDALEETRRQLDRFDRENLDWPPPPAADPAPTRKRPPLSPLLWVLAVIGMFCAQGSLPGLTDAALLDASRVFAHGEGWRAASALWLHADLGHLAANAVGGLLVFTAVVSTFGTLPGWSLIAGSAIAGNLLSVSLHHGEVYSSLGASTAVCAGLGLRTGRALRLAGRPHRPHRRRAVFVALGSGLVMLGLFGAGADHIDVPAHAAGFIAGLILGLLAAPDLASAQH
jgi:membrane associated rhomboid family serine protease